MPTLTFKVTAEEEAKIRRAARARKSTLSDYLRGAAVPKSPGRTAVYRTRTDKLTGLPVSITPPGITVTSEQVRAALADFP